MKEAKTNYIEERDKEWHELIRITLEELANKLVDRDTNFGMNESYRCALDDVAKALLAAPSPN